MSGASSTRRGVLCQCTGVTYAEVEQARAANPRISVERLCATLGCGTECGSCLPQVQEMLGQQAWYAATAQATALTTARDLAGLERLIFGVQLTLAGDSSYPRVLPGQHIALRARTGAGTVDRTYTVVAQDQAAGTLALAIRRTPGGKLTPWLLDGGGATREVEISAPGGRALGSGGRRPDVFFAGGVGITPAVAIAGTLGSKATLHVHYSVGSAEDAAFLPEFDARRRAHPGFSYTLRETSLEGPLDDSAIAAIARAQPGAKFFICGPEGYVETVRRGLARAGVEPARIHVELFAMAARKGKVKSSRSAAWYAGALLAALPLLLLQTPLEAQRPHGHPNVGHEQLKCVACHADTGASTRQVLQAKVKYALGLRQTGAVLGTQPVTSATCVQCHANPDDRHPPQRVLEPRFAQARQETGAQLCVSCHREHQATRVSLPAANYCVSCHQDTQVKDDRIAPTHATLIADKRWETCLQCHDYHGNHRWITPKRLVDAPSVELLEKYLKGGPSPYGSTIVKAKQE